MNKEFYCDLCGSKEFLYKPNHTKKLVYEKPAFEIVKCRKCSLFSLFPIPNNEDLEWIYSNYASKGNRIIVEKERQEYVYPRKIELIRKYHPKAKSVLDIGAGLGGFAAICRGNGYEVTGIEMVKNQVEIAKSVFDIELKNMSFESFQKENNKTYDIVMLHHVLEHLQHPIKILKEVKSTMDKNSILLIEVPNQFFNLKQIINKFLGRTILKYPNNPYHHIYFFSPRTLQLVVERAGFKIIRMNEVSARPKPKVNIIKFLFTHLLHKIGIGWSGRLELVARIK